MIATDLGRAGLLALVPFSALTHRLTFLALTGIAAIVGALTVLFDVAYQSYLPTLVAREELLESNRRLSMSSSTAEMLGPALTGVLVQAITAPLAVLLDAASFLASTLSVWAIQKSEPAPEKKGDLPLLTEAFDGMRFIWNQPALRSLLLRSVTAFLAMGVISPLYLLSAIRIVHMNTSALGLAIALGGAGSLAGAWVAAHFSRHLGLGWTFFTTAILVGCAQLLIPISAHFARFGFAFLCVQQFGGDLCWTIYIVNETTNRQALAPQAVMGRVSSTMQLASHGVLPFGAIAGGLLAQRFGIPFTLWIGASGVLLSCIWLAPLRNTRHIEPQWIQGHG